MTNDSPFFDDREHIFENSVGFVILDRYPVSEGHCLIVSKRVYSNQILIPLSPNKESSD